MARFLPFFVQEMGAETESTFKWGKALPIFAGLGLTPLRFIADKLEGIYPDWGFYASCSDEELIKEIREARGISGYPLALLRCDFLKMHDTFNGESIQKVPHWWGQLMVLHIIKHSRFFKNHRGKPYVYVAYKGRHAMIPLSDQGARLPLNAVANQPFLKTFCDVLRIPRSTSKNKGLFEVKAASILGFISPYHLPEPLD